MREKVAFDLRRKTLSPVMSGGGGGQFTGKKESFMRFPPNEG